MGEFETVMQTRDQVEGLHNYCRVFISGYVNTEKKFSIAFINQLFREKTKKFFVMGLIKREILTSGEVLYT